MLVGGMSRWVLCRRGFRGRCGLMVFVLFDRDVGLEDGGWGVWWDVAVGKEVRGWGVEMGRMWMGGKGVDI